MAKAGVYDPAYPADTVLVKGPPGPDAWVMFERGDWDEQIRQDPLFRADLRAALDEAIAMSFDDESYRVTEPMDADWLEKAINKAACTCGFSPDDASASRARSTACVLWTAYSITERISYVF